MNRKTVEQQFFHPKPHRVAHRFNRTPHVQAMLELYASVNEALLNLRREHLRLTAKLRNEFKYIERDRQRDLIGKKERRA